MDHSDEVCGSSNGLGLNHLICGFIRYQNSFLVKLDKILKYAFFLALSCVYCGFKFSELYSTGDGFDDFSFTTNVQSYLELSYTWLVFLIISGIILLIVLLLLCFMRTRIKIAIELIEEASIAVGHMMSTLFFPIVPFVLEVIFVAWFLIVGAFLASSNSKVYHININGGKEGICTLANGTVLKDGEGCSVENANYTCTESVIDSTICQFYKYGPTTEATYFQVYTILKK
jgi:choline transporter-like protein 2/4/5